MKGIIYVNDEETKLEDIEGFEDFNEEDIKNFNELEELEKEKGYSFSPSIYGYGISITIDEENSIEKMINDEEKIKKAIEIERMIDFHENDYILEFIEKNADNLFESVEYISLSLKKQTPLEFINNNPSILSKKIIIPIRIELTDSETLANLVRTYNGLTDKIYVSLEGNSGYVNLDDCQKVFKIIDKEVEYIRQLNLSPMETIMYVYDKIKTRVYLEENENELFVESRDLSAVMLGDKIVCVGYSRLLKTYLNKLGIDANELVLENRVNDTSGHARNIIYVNDPKYNIDGVYCFDSTFDSKKRKDDKTFVNRYRYFAKTIDQMNTLDNNYYSIYDLPKISNEFFEEVKAILEKRKSVDFFDNIKYIKTIKFMEKVLRTKNIEKVSPLIKLLDRCEPSETAIILSRLKKIINMFNKQLSAETMLSVYDKVRQVESLENPAEYPHTLEDTYIVFDFAKWEFEMPHYRPEESLLRTLLGDDSVSKNRTKKENFFGFIHETNKNKKVEETRMKK